MTEPFPEWEDVHSGGEAGPVVEDDLLMDVSLVVAVEERSAVVIPVRAVLHPADLAPPHQLQPDAAELLLVGQLDTDLAGDDLAGEEDLERILKLNSKVCQSHDSYFPFTANVTPPFAQCEICGLDL